MARKKHKGNISGLRNQPKQPSHVKKAPTDNCESTGTLPIPPPGVINAPSDQLDLEADGDDIEWDHQIRPDSSKPVWDLPELASDDEEEPNSDAETLECENNDEIDKAGKDDVKDEVTEEGDQHWRGEGLHVGLMVLAIEIGDDPRDEDWIPESVRRMHQARLARGELIGPCFISNKESR